MNAKIIIAFVFFMLFVGWVAGELGLSAPLIELPEIASQSWWDKLVSPVTWVINAGANFVALMTFQVDGLPVLLNTLVFIPIGFGVAWMVVALVRGTS